MLRKSKIHLKKISRIIHVHCNSKSSAYLSKHYKWVQNWEIMYIWDGSIDSIKADRVWNVLWSCHFDILFTGKWQLYTVLYVNWIHMPQATHTSKWQNGCEEVQHPDAHELKSKRWIVFSFRLLGAFRFRLWLSVVVRLTWMWRLLTYIIIFKQPKLVEIIFLFVFLDRVTFLSTA